MRTFTKVTPAMWTSPQFQKLSDQARLLWFYYVTGPHQTICGASRVPDGYAAQDLGWAVETCEKVRHDLINGDMILTDEETKEVLVLGWWRDNFPDNQSHTVSAKRAIACIASATLQKAALDSLSQEAEKREGAKRAASGGILEAARQSNSRPYGS